MRKKLPVLLIALIILLQAFTPAVYASSENEVQSQTAYLCPFDPTSEGAGEVAKKTDFFVAPSGEAIPATKQGIMDNLTKLTEKNGKYYGSDSNGPIRIKPNEVHQNNPNHTGPMSDLHTVPHMHIDRKVNGTTGDWIHKITLPWNMLE
ncbi:hypothetical protein [Tepidibacillus marianensis]|uniref:hypothetical protein n=1 Tax=Tepidibacillus marianensis TaxID=3131995 RepID=UPI0030D1FB59